MTFSVSGHHCYVCISLMWTGQTFNQSLSRERMCWGTCVCVHNGGVCVCFWGRGDMIVDREAGHVGVDCVLVSGASRELFVTEMCVCVYTCGRCA